MPTELKSELRIEADANDTWRMYRDDEYLGVPSNTNIELWQRLQARESLTKKLAEALLQVDLLAIEAHQHWDKDRDSKVGKILIALAGFCKGYRADIDLIRDAIEEAEEAQKQG